MTWCLTVLVKSGYTLISLMFNLKRMRFRFMSDIISRLAMILGIFSAINMQDITQNITNPMMWVCLVCIGTLYIMKGMS